MEKFKYQAILILEKKIDDHKWMGKIFHLSAKIIVSDIDKAFRFIYESVMMKNGIVDTIMEHGITIFEF